MKSFPVYPGKPALLILPTVRNNCSPQISALSSARGIGISTERIDINPAVIMGKPVIRGTRITVELLLRKLAQGASEADLLQDYPHLTTEDIRAAVAYGAASVAP